MVKTKTRVKTNIKANTEKIEKTAPKIEHKSCSSTCWVCSLFKLMVVLFIVMVIFWLGFFFGDLAGRTSFGLNYRAMSISQADCVKNLKTNNKNLPVDQLASKINSILANKEGNEFDKEFLLEMTINHQATIDMAKLALTKSSRADIKAFAQSIIDNNTKAIKQMETWKTEWFKAQ